MSGQIVPGSRNGLTSQGYPGLGSILNSDSSLLNRNSQGTLNQQSQQINVNGTRPPMFSSKQPTQNRIVPSPTRGYSPTDNFRRDLLSNPPMLDLPERDDQFPHWRKLERDNRFLLDNSDFPALGQKGMRHGFNERTPSSPSALPPSRPGSISDGLRQTLSDTSHLSPSPLSSLTRPSMMGLDHPLSTSGSGQIPGLSLNSRTNYLQTLSKTSNQERNDDFALQTEDFPALDNPTKPSIGQSTLDDDPSTRYANFRNFNDFTDQSVFSTLEPNLRQQQLLQGVQNHPRRDEMGTIKFDPVSSKLNSIPASMLTDKYSFIGCLHVLEQIFENSKPNNTEQKPISSGPGSSAASSNGVTPPPGVAPPPGVVSANGSPGGSPPGVQRASGRTQFPTLDKDMTKMGISFIKDNRLIYRFQSPFADMPCRVQDIDMFVPGEYLTNIHIREKLAEIKPSKYNEDLLFWMFYSNPNDHMQLTAADELIRRNWRFHKEKKIWISKTQNIKLREQNHHYEEGTFHVWDVESWKKVAKDMRVEYSKLEDVSPLHSSGRQM